MVAIWKGLVYTQQAVSGLRFDQSCLDRIYSSYRGQWYAYMHTIEHDGRHTLLDHIPITSYIILKEEEDGGLGRAYILRWTDHFLRMRYSGRRYTRYGSKDLGIFLMQTQECNGTFYGSASNKSLERKGIRGRSCGTALVRI